jgi:hypothetical protein
VIEIGLNVCLLMKSIQCLLPCGFSSFPTSL